MYKNYLSGFCGLFLACTFLLTGCSVASTSAATSQNLPTEIVSSTENASSAVSSTPKSETTSEYGEHKYTPEQQKLVDENTATSAEFVYGSDGTEPITLSEGDTFSGLTLTELNFHPDLIEISDSVTMAPSIDANFTGDITLTGTFYASNELGDVPSQAYFIPDENSDKKLPYPVFCIDIFKGTEQDTPIGIEPIFLRSFDNDGKEQDPLLTNITGIGQTDGTPCEIVLGSYSWFTVWDITTYSSGTLKSFKAL